MSKQTLCIIFKDENSRTSHSEYHCPQVEIKDYNVKINGKNAFDKPINNDLQTHGNIRKIATGQGGDDYTTAFLLDYPYFKQNYKMIAIDSSKQQALNADSRAIRQINFTANLDRVGNTTTFFIIEEVNLRLFTRNCKSVVNKLQNDLFFINIK